MATKVFISYRRDDSRYQARMIHAAFCKALPSDHVFMDIDSITPGANFRKILKDWIDQCEVLLALIGPGWIDARDPKTQQRRLDNESDFVRIEIGEALARGIPVVPVLLDDTPMPDIKFLSDDLKGLVDRQAEFVEYRTFDTDVERLIRKLGLNQSVGGTNKPQQPISAAVPASSDDLYRGEGRIKVEAAFAHGAPEGWFLPGNGKTEWFRDSNGGPEMVVVPAGGFTMGSARRELGRRRDEDPQRKVTFANPFAAGRFAVTFEEWDACVADGGCNGYRPIDEGWGRSRRPVIYVSWNDAKAYVEWLAKKTGKPYRLLSEAEWEYAARAGSTTAFWWGDSISTREANYDGSYPYPKSDGSGLLTATQTEAEFRQRTLPVNSFDPNPWGLYQVHGNVWEWTEDCYEDTYQAAPIDGSAATIGDSGRRVIRGGCWLSNPEDLRSAARYRLAIGFRCNVFCLRVGRTLLPP
jgi:formylglycine-generating enzyme required for sulfatase activity